MIRQSLYPQDPLISVRVEARKSGLAEKTADTSARLVKAGVVQMENRPGDIGQKDRNLERMLDFIALAQKEQLDILVFPELCLCGYSTSGDLDEVVARCQLVADSIDDSPYIRTLRERAKQTGLIIAFGFIEQADHALYNSLGLISSDGNFLGCRRKAPLYPYPYETRPFRPGTDRSQVFDTPIGKIGLAICFDGCFFESVRQMRLQGAEILVWSNAACGSAQHGDAHLQVVSGALAYGNSLRVLTSDCTGSNFVGLSCIYDITGDPLVQLSPTEEALGVAAFDLSAQHWEVWRSNL